MPCRTTLGRAERSRRQFGKVRGRDAIRRIVSIGFPIAARWCIEWSYFPRVVVEPMGIAQLAAAGVDQIISNATLNGRAVPRPLRLVFG